LNNIQSVSFSIKRCLFQIYNQVWMSCLLKMLELLNC
jgi:hypothetical protein